MEKQLPERVHRYGWVLGLGWLLLAAAGMATEPSAPSLVPADLALDIQDERLTLHAENAALDEILRAIADRAGFALTIDGTVGAPESRYLTDVPLDEGLRRLLDGRSYRLTVEPSVVGGAPRPIHLHVYGAGGSPHPVPVENTARIRRLALERATERADNGDYGVVEERLSLARSAARRGRASVPDEAIFKLAVDADSAVRGLAVAALGKSGGGEVGEVLIDALADSDPRVRRRAVLALADAWGHQSVEHLEAIATGDRSRAVRRAAAFALSGQAGAAAEAAMASLAENADPQVRRIAEAALGTLQTP
jgi:hypothetical protein